jgi:2-dehydropantoate 2-reductase
MKRSRAAAASAHDSTVLMPGPVLVMGAGAIGCYVGGLLAQAGLEVHFVGRERVLAPMRESGLKLTDLDGKTTQLSAASVSLFEVLQRCEPALVLLCVKSPHTAEAAALLEAHVPAGTVVLSLQNGVSNASVAAAAAPSLAVVPAMVPFNVVQMVPGHYHRATSGELAAQENPVLKDWQSHFARAGLPLNLHEDLQAIQWGKLLLNLNNPVNALSGLPLREQLQNSDMRAVTAALQREALGIMDVAGIKPAKLTPLPMGALPFVLGLPTWLFKRVAASMLRIDERARSSMADDIAMGRPTEIDALCGEVVRLAAKAGMKAPTNARMMLMINAARPDMRKRSGSDMLKTLGLKQK